MPRTTHSLQTSNRSKKPRRWAMALRRAMVGAVDNEWMMTAIIKIDEGDFRDQVWG